MWFFCRLQLKGFNLPEFYLQYYLRKQSTSHTLVYDHGRTADLTSAKMVVVVTWNKYGMHSQAGAWERDCLSKNIVGAGLVPVHSWTNFLRGQNGKIT